LLDENKEIIYTWSADKIFIMMETQTVIDPGKTVEFADELIWKASGYCQKGKVFEGIYCGSK